MVIIILKNAKRNERIFWVLKGHKFKRWPSQCDLDNFQSDFFFFPFNFQIFFRFRRLLKFFGLFFRRIPLSRTLSTQPPNPPTPPPPPANPFKHPIPQRSPIVVFYKKSEKKSEKSYFQGRPPQIDFIFVIYTPKKHNMEKNKNTFMFRWQ